MRLRRTPSRSRSVVIGVKGPDYCDEDCVKAMMWGGAINLAGMVEHASYGGVRFPEALGAVTTIALDARNPIVDQASELCQVWAIASLAGLSLQAGGPTHD